MQKGNSDISRVQVIRSVGWSLAQSWGTRAVSLGVFAFLARVLDPQDFGVAAFAMIWIAFINSILEQGAGEALVQTPEITDDDLHTAFWLSLCLGILLLTVACLAAPLLADLLQMKQLNLVLPVLSCSFLAGALGTVPTAILRRKMDFRTLAIRSVIATTISGIAAITAAIQGWGVWSLVLQTLIYSFAMCVLGWLATDWRPARRFVRSSARRLGSFGSNVLASRLSEFFSVNMPDFAIGVFFGPTALGFYSVASKLVTILSQLLSQVVLQVAFVAFSRIQNDRPRLRLALIESSRLSAVAAFPVFLLFAANAYNIITFVFGDRWSDAVPLMQALCVLGAVHSLSYLFGTALAAIGTPGYRTVIMLSRALLSLFAVLSFGRGNPSNLVYSYVGGSLIATPIALILAHRIIGFSLRSYFTAIIKPLLSSALSAAAIAMLLSLPQVRSQNVLVQALFGTCMGAALYIAALVALDRDAFNALISLGKGRLRKAPKGAEDLGS